MQTLTANGRVAEAQPQASLGESAREWARVMNQWLDTESAIGSRMVEERVTRRTVIRINLITLASGVCAVAAETDFLVSLMSVTAAGWLVYRLNHGEQKGGEA